MRLQKAKRLWSDIEFPTSCAYCGQEITLETVEKEHVVASQFFPKRQHAQLPVVPACSICNRGIEKDEEYTRLMICSDIRCYFHPAAREVFSGSETIIGSGGVERSIISSKGLQAILARSMRIVSTYSRNGIYLGEEPALQVDNDRLARVFVKIAMGLYWHIKRKPIPIGYGVFVDLNLSEDKLNAPLNSRIIDNPVRTLGDNAFNYVFVPQDEHVNYDTIIMAFYNGYFTIAAICPIETIFGDSIPSPLHPKRARDNRQ